MSLITKIPGGNELLDAQEVLKKIGLAENMKVGDLGCGGKGYFSLQAAKMIGQGGLVYAVDILKSSLKSVSHLAESMGIYNIKTVWSNLEKVGATKINNGELDIALVINLLFQVEKKENVIQEARRLLKTGGKLVIIDWKKTGAPFGPPVESRIDFVEIENIAADQGFIPQQQFEAGSFHQGLIFLKQ